MGRLSWSHDHLQRALYKGKETEICNAKSELFGQLTVPTSQLWRVNRCMRYKRKQVELWRVMWPSLVLFSLVIILLSVWTAKDGFVWVRNVLDENTGETIGTCASEQTLQYLGPIYLLHTVPTVLAGVMAYKTNGIDDEYSEAKWVLIFILVQIQVCSVLAVVPQGLPFSNHSHTLGVTSGSTRHDHTR